MLITVPTHKHTRQKRSRLSPEPRGALLWVQRCPSLCFFGCPAGWIPPRRTTSYLLDSCPADYNLPNVSLEARHHAAEVRVGDFQPYLFLLMRFFGWEKLRGSFERLGEPLQLPKVIAVRAERSPVTLLLPLRRPSTIGATVKKASVRLWTKQINASFCAHCHLETIRPL